MTPTAVATVPTMMPRIRHYRDVDQPRTVLVDVSALSLSRGRSGSWAWVELNYRPHAYQACALTT